MKVLRSIIVEDEILAIELLMNYIEKESLAAVYINCPDPWPKKRHHKRRLISPAFAALLVERMCPGGRLRLATDWQDYAEQMLIVLNAEPGLINEAGDGFAERFDGRNITRFEARGQRLGHSVWDLSYLKRQSPLRAS